MVACLGVPHDNYLFITSLLPHNGVARRLARRMVQTLISPWDSGTWHPGTR